VPWYYCFKEAPTETLDTNDAVSELTCEKGSLKASVSFDLREGVISAYANAPNPVDAALTRVDVWDTYTLVGPSGDETHSFQVVFSFEGYAPASHLEAYIRQGIEEDAPQTQIRCCESTIVYDLSKRVGEPFSFAFGIMAWDDWEYYARGTMTISFSGLDGLGITSCHGYGPTPVAPITWGRIKSRYR
jgi:hypothetical protein